MNGQKERQTDDKNREKLPLKELAEQEQTEKTVQDSQENLDENDMLIVTDFDGDITIGTAIQILQQWKCRAQAWERKPISDEEYFKSTCKWAETMSIGRINTADLQKDLSEKNIKKRARILYNRIGKEIMDVEKCDPNNMPYEIERI